MVKEVECSVLCSSYRNLIVLLTQGPITGTHLEASG